MQKNNTVEFAKIIPGGNPTLILSANRLTLANLPAVAAELMHPMHLEAEQVGRLDLEGDIPHLQMMGGEFCVNATRAAAALLAQRGIFSPARGYAGCAKLELSVSGAPHPVFCLLAPTHEILMRALMAEKPEDERSRHRHETAASRDTVDATGCFAAAASSGMLQIAARIACAEVTVEEQGAGVFLVRMPGITHLLLDESIHPMPENWRMESAEWRSRHRLEGEAACGVVWFTKKRGEYRIRPAVFVAATGSEHMETACGSASLALAMALRKVGELPPMLTICQPSMERLYILFSSPTSAWVSGGVFIAALGTAAISRTQKPHCG